MNQHWRSIKALALSINFFGYIEVSDDGFWKHRSSPQKSLIYACNLFNKIGGKTIVEVGTGLKGSFNGNSMLYWADKTKAEEIYAVDSEQGAIDEIKNLKRSNIIPICQTGLDFFKGFNGKVDLLYLDFWTGNLTKENSLEIGFLRAQAHLEIYNAAKNSLNPSSILLIDDTDHIEPWKQTYIVPEARRDGFRVIWTGRQTLLLRTT